jgi:hypothetical protein
MKIKPFITGFILVVIFFLLPPPSANSQMGGGYICGQFQIWKWGRNGGPAFVPFGTENTPYSSDYLTHLWWIVVQVFDLPVTSTGDTLDVTAILGKNIRIWNPGFSGGSSFYLESVGSYEFVDTCTPVVDFSVERESITSGECTNLNWFVDNVSDLNGVYLNDELINPVQGSRNICPTGDTSYILRVNAGWGEISKTVTVNVVSPTPPDIQLTDFTLADTLPETGFSYFQTPMVFKPNVLWIQITNVGQSPFYPPGGSGQYTLQVILKQTGGKLEEYDYVSGHPTSLASLGNFEAGESQNYFVPDLFLHTATDNAELEIFFLPDANLGMQNSILSKPVTVQENPDSFQRCAATVTQIMVGVATIYCPACLPAVIYPDLALRTLKCGNDAICIAKEDAKWVIGLVLGPSKEIGKLLSLAADAILSINDEHLPCMIASDWLNTFLNEAIRNMYNVNGVTTQSPVYPLVSNEAGQRSGFLENGQIVEEIPDSKVFLLGEERHILYPGNNSSQISVFGYAEGKMNLFTTLSQGIGTGISIRYTDVDVTQGMMATVGSSSNQYPLEIDTNGDGTIDQSLLPDEILAITENGEFQKPIETPTSIVPTSIVPTVASSTPSQQPGSFCNSIFGLIALPILVIWKQRRKK